MSKKETTVEKQGIKDFFKFVIQVGLLAVFIRAFTFEPFNIPSGSMIPSLLVGDYLFVSKYSYGFSKYSIPFGYAFDYFNGRFFQFRKPARGEVVVFRLPSDPKVDYIKRVVGLPGDRVQMRSGVLYINDVAAELKEISSYQEKAEVDGGLVTATLYEETLPGGATHPIIKQVPLGAGPLDNTPVYTVPEGHYFVMGDNRDGSSDSRVLHAVGYIPEDHLIGQAEIIFFSTDGTAKVWEFWKWFSAARWSRILSWIW